jgi:hypothetical protein
LPAHRATTGIHQFRTAVNANNESSCGRRFRLVLFGTELGSHVLLQERSPLFHCRASMGLGPPGVSDLSYFSCSMQSRSIDRISYNCCTNWGRVVDAPFHQHKGMCNLEYLRRGCDCSHANESTNQAKHQTTRATCGQLTNSDCFPVLIRHPTSLRTYTQPSRALAGVRKQAGREHVPFQLLHRTQIPRHVSSAARLGLRPKVRTVF